MSRLNILWVTDHCCYDGILHAGGRLFLNVIPRFNPDKFRIIPAMIRSSDEVREIFENSVLDVDIFDASRFDLRTISKFRRMIKEEPLDVMHLHCYGTSTYGRIAAKLTGGVPTILHDYDTDFYFPYPWYLEAVDNLLAPYTAGAIASNPLVAQFTLERRKIPREKIRLMFHPVLDDRYEPVSREASMAMRDKLDVPQEATLVGAFTKLAPERGNEFLLESFKQVVEAKPDTYLVFGYSPTEFHRLPRGYDESTHTIGKDKNRTALEDQARKLGILDKVRFFETVDIPNELEAACDLQVAPWLGERFSIARVLDALPKGLPLISTNVGEPPHIITEGVDGYVAPAGNVAEYSQKLLGAISNPDHLARLQAGAKEKAKKFHIDHFVHELEDWYTELAAQHRRS